MPAPRTTRPSAAPNASISIPVEVREQFQFLRARIEADVVALAVAIRVRLGETAQPIVAGIAVAADVKPRRGILVRVVVGPPVIPSLTRLQRDRVFVIAVAPAV